MGQTQRLNFSNLAPAVWTKDQQTKGVTIITKCWKDVK